MRAKFVGNNIHNITPSDVLDKATLDELWNYDNMDEYIVYEYAIEYNIDYKELEDDEEFLESKELRDYFNYQMEYLCDNVIYTFENDIINHDDTIDIWRHMKVKPDWKQHLLKEGKHLGIYWSWDEHAAEPHWGYGADRSLLAVLESKVNQRYVDWKSTIINNMNPWQRDEKEVTLRRGTPIKLESLEIDGKQVEDISILNKIYLS